MRPVGSPITDWAKKSNEYSPILAASSMIGQGVSSRSSHSWAAGRTTVSAKSWTHFCIWSWSSWRGSENSDIAAASGRRQVSYRSVTRLRGGRRRDKHRAGKFPGGHQRQRQRQQHRAGHVGGGDAGVLEQGAREQGPGDAGEPAGGLLEAED